MTIKIKWCTDDIISGRYVTFYNFARESRIELVDASPTKLFHSIKQVSVSNCAVQLITVCDGGRSSFADIFDLVSTLAEFGYEPIDDELVAKAIASRQRTYRTLRTGS